MSINKANFKRVLAAVEKSVRARKQDNKTFDYGIWFNLSKPHATVGAIVKHPCGTVGCLGGWGAVFQQAEDDPTYPTKEFLFTDAKANEFYGISPKDGRFLYYGYWHALGVRAPVEDVIAKLKNIIATGKVRNRAFDKQYAAPRRTDLD